MKTARAVLLLTLAVLVAAPLFAAAPKKEKPPKKAPPSPAAQRVERMLMGLTITDEQKGKLEAIQKEFDPKFVEALKAADVFTPEQKEARNKAATEAKAAGKKGKEFQEALNAAVELSEEQKAKLAEAKKPVAALDKELRQQVMAVLTDEQKAELKKKAAEAKKAKPEK